MRLKDSGIDVTGVFREAIHSTTNRRVIVLSPILSAVQKLPSGSASCSKVLRLRIAIKKRTHDDLLLPVGQALILESTHDPQAHTEVCVDWVDSSIHSDGIRESVNEVVHASITVPLSPLE